MRLSLAISTMALTTMVSVDGARAAEALKPNMEKCKIAFVGGKPDGSTHDGGFKKFTVDAKGTIAEPSQASLKIVIDMNSLYADNPKLEGHLKNPDFFDVRKYPTAVFESTKIEANEKECVAVGRLKMLGKTEEIKIPLKVEHSQGLIKLTSQFKLDRTKWGMNYGMEGNKINKDVVVDVALEFTH